MRSLAKEAGKAYLQWLMEDERTAGPQGINITLLDFAIHDFPQYCAIVIGLNYK